MRAVFKISHGTVIGFQISTDINTPIGKNEIPCEDLSVFEKFDPDYYRVFKGKVVLKDKAEIELIDKNRNILQLKNRLLYLYREKNAISSAIGTLNDPMLISKLNFINSEIGTIVSKLKQP